MGLLRCPAPQAHLCRFESNTHPRLIVFQGVCWTPGFAFGNGRRSAGLGDSPSAMSAGRRSC